MNTQENIFTHGSLFSGIGGFDLAAEWIGWRNAFHCEINEFCTKILNYHFPNAEHYTDIKKTDFSKWRDKIDILSGGFPCQPFSVAGKRKGTDDDRYLWPEMLRAIQEIRPTWIVGENVAGITSMVQPGKEVEMGYQESIFGEDNRERVLLRQEYIIETICKDIEREGYSVQPIIIPACAVGAPHKRDRIWFISYLVENTERIRCNSGEPQKEPNIGQFRESFTGDYVRVCGKKDEANHCTDTGAESMQQTGENDIHAIEFTPDAKSEQSQWSKFEQPQNGTKEQREFGRICCKNHSGHTIRGWGNFPTQSPVCRGDDGVSTRLDGITFSKWREESIKAYGNAIVPQVAYEIFKAIHETYYK